MSIGPHIVNGHYMFGNTFVQPDMAWYDSYRHHIKAPIVRNMCDCNPSCENRPFDDGMPYITDSGKKCNCTNCPNNDIVRNPLMMNLINIETSLIKSLKVTLYGINKDMDKTIIMNLGKRYAVTYITEIGLIMSVGYLKVISDSVPDECTKYIGSNMSIASTAYIGLDCSTEGNSDKKKIYISSIRYIEEVNDEDNKDQKDDKSDNTDTKDPNNTDSTEDTGTEDQNNKDSEDTSTKDPNNTDSTENTDKEV